MIDWFSRYILSWRISISLDADFCIEALKDAIEKYGQPDIFNTDQGSQFTSKNFIAVLTEHEIQISMDGKGPALDNVFIETQVLTKIIAIFSINEDKNILINRK